MIGMALTVKAGALLTLPAILGTIQWRYGTFTTLSALAIIVGLSALVALPFISNEAALLLGFKNGANGGVIDYIEATKLFGGKLEEDTRGGHYGLSIYFRFIVEELYAD